MFDSCRYEFRQAMRALARRPGPTAVTVLVMAVGIGATTGVFSVANWLLIRPVPGVAVPEEIVTIHIQPRNGAGLFPTSFPVYQALTDLPSIAGLAGYTTTALHVAIDDRALRVPAEVVTPGYFRLLGLRFTLGRPFTDEEAMGHGGARVAVVSERFWQRSLGAAEVAGRPLSVNGHLFTITGVAPRGFRGPALPGETDVWVPVGAHREVLPTYPANLMANRRTGVFFGLLARRSPGASVERVQADADVRFRQIIEAHPDDRRIQNRVAAVYPGVGTMPWQRDRLTQALGLLMAIVTMLLVLTCANVANLALARVTASRAEVAVRQALGASRARVVGQTLLQMAIVAVAGGLLALMFVTWIGSWLEGQPVLKFITLDRVQVDVRVFLFALGLSLAAGLLAAIVPALAASRATMLPALRESARTQVPRGRLRWSLSVAQIAISLTLLVGAGLLSRSLAALQSVDLGVDASGALSFSVDPGLQGYATEPRDAFYRTLLDRLRAQPGVDAAGLAWIEPFGTSAADTEVVREGEPNGPRVSAYHNIVSPGFFPSLGIPLVAGREFVDSEFLARRTDGLWSVILSESVARELFPGEAAVGQLVTLAYPEGRRWEVVGVAADARMRALEGPPHFVYEPFGQPFATGSASLHVRGRIPAGDIAALIRREVAALDPAMPVYNLRTVGEAVERSLAEPRLIAAVSGAFAFLAAMLAALGIYGVISQGVAERTRELGIRTALGASPGRILAGVAWQGVTLAITGAAMGLFAAAVLTRFVEARLHGIDPLDAVSFAGATTLVLALAIGATLLPAVRAARVNPVVALRKD